jgi:ABC-type polysaccharide/polyol phosphate transport system ATPase subunit
MNVIQFDQVSKRFTLHRQRSRSFQELFLNIRHFTRRPARREQGHGKEPYWALRDVSFKVAPGEMVGIIGPNGAGKSTILKLVSRIIEPTSGRIDVNGSVGALLELGAGFHPDLTGRENVYLNGSFLGFSKPEMNHIFDDIVGFSGMGRFIDVPVKHYSSGMYMRLGFSIAIHLRPKILLVDEVLAVGDQSFQIRCLDKIQELKRQGIAILFVTHDLESVHKMCDRAIWLDKGQIQIDGPVEQVLEQYVAQVLADSEQTLLADEVAHQPVAARVRESGNGAPGDASRRWGTREGEITRVQILDAQGQERRAFQSGERFVVRMHFAARQRIEKPQFGLALHNANGLHINGPNTVVGGLDIEAIEDTGVVDYVVESLPLLEGTYLLSVILCNYEGTHTYDFHHQAYTFRVRPSESIAEKYGTFLIPSSWRIEFAGEGQAPVAQKEPTGEGK